MICCIEGCKNYTQHAGMCNLHYRRARRANPDRRIRWTAEENAVLIANYAKLGPKQLAALIPSRTAKAIRIQACVLGVQHKREVPRRNERPDPHRLVMVGAALRMWAAPAWAREQPMRWAA